MAAPYLTPQAAQTRLAAYSITATPTPKELELASDDLDLMGPRFLGTKYTTDLTVQMRQFPRSITLPGDTPGVVPEKVLDWVSMKAYGYQIDDEPPVKLERIEDIAQTYTRGKRSRLDRLMDNLLKPYTRGSYRIV